VDEVGAELLAVRDHVDPGGLLLLEPDQRRILLGALERLPLVAPGSPELSGSASHAGFGRLPATVVSNMMPPLVLLLGAPDHVARRFLEQASQLAASRARSYSHTS
jgi:hypothetical protein